MAKEFFVEHSFTAGTIAIVDQARMIINEYMEQGFNLTLRQLYYQFVARSWIENSYRSYKRVGSILGHARLAGLIDWEAIEDRTRELKRNPHWSNEKAMMKSAIGWFEIDKWKNQPNRVEVWIEKEALSGVIKPICSRLDVPFFACKGYPSLSEMYEAAKRLARFNDGGQNVHILHLGDHDPSGIDMTRDIEKRITLMAERMVSINRLALNWDQIDLYNPPPFFVKLKDSRAGGYVQEFGLDSWELDALDPATLTTIIEGAVLNLRDEDVWNEDVREQEEMTVNLRSIHKNWDGIMDFLDNGETDDS